MLYKKYHKNYIRQFKLGTEIIIGCEYGVVTEEPSLGGISGKEYIQIRLRNIGSSIMGSYFFFSCISEDE